ncbi:MAG: zinc ribbon domain-containing protein [Lachnospiraceae bacterium]|nr:zinc ribbon domain-containing protein [Lachnospiraceae bacterium]
MKCPTCGANLQIEDETCPFCGNPNPFAVKHQQDMRHFQQEFQKTKQEVEKKTLHFNSFTARIAVIAALLVMVLGMIYVMDRGPYYLWSSRIERDIAKNVQKYGAELSACEEAGAWRRLYALHDVKSLDHTRDFQEYTVLSFVIFDYKSILNQMTSFREENGNDAATASARMASHLDSFYKSTGRSTFGSTYFDNNYTPKHMEAYGRMQEDLEAALSVYCHLTKEEVAALSDYSVVKKAALIEEGLHREADEVKEAEK